MADTATLEARLAEAETAYHKLAMGERVVSVTFPDGKTIAYTASRLSDLAAYIATLRAQLGTTPRRAVVPYL